MDFPLESWHRIYLRTLMVVPHDLSRDNLGQDGKLLPRDQWQVSGTSKQLIEWGLAERRGDLIWLTPRGKEIAAELMKKKVILPVDLPKKS